MSDSSELKHLQTQLSTEQSKLVDHGSKLAKCRQDHNKIKRKIHSLESKIDKLTNNVVVSEHAILRYMERVMNFDVTDIKTKILMSEKAMDSLGTGKFPCEGGGRAIVVDNTVVSVIKD